MQESQECNMENRTKNVVVVAEAERCGKKDAMELKDVSERRDGAQRWKQGYT